MAMPDINHRRRSITLAEQILARILDGTYRVGTQLPTERELALEAGVSRSTAREAILTLELVGSVKVRHGEGTFVTDLIAPFTEVSERVAINEQPRQLIQARKYIEPFVAKLVATSPKETDLTNISSLVDEAASLIKSPAEIVRFSRLGLEFHSALSRLCHNQIMGSISLELTNVSKHPLWLLVNQIAVREEAARVAQVQEHRDIVTALAAKDGDKVFEIMKVHLENLQDTVFFGEADHGVPDPAFTASPLGM